MPAGSVKNLLYRAALPVLVRKPVYKVSRQGRPLQQEKKLLSILQRQRVQNAAVSLSAGTETAAVFASVNEQKVDETSLFRVASVTKMATALVTLRLIEAGAFKLDTSVEALVPGTGIPKDITIRHLLTHTSGLRDIDEVDRALQSERPFSDVIRAGAVQAKAGESFAYCNFAFGLLGCIFEKVTEKALPQVFEKELFKPLQMNGSIDACWLQESRIVPIQRILSRVEQKAVTITPLGRKGLTSPDPMRHFGHTAGAMYTDVNSLDRMMGAILGEVSGYLTEGSLREMRSVQSSYGSLDRRMKYGLGLLLIEDPQLPGTFLVGHQGYAYGCVDGAFVDAYTGRKLISLNGGASEARTGRLGCLNQELIHWAYGKEIPSWK